MSTKRAQVVREAGRQLDVHRYEPVPTWDHDVSSGPPRHRHRNRLTGDICDPSTGNPLEFSIEARAVSPQVGPSPIEVAAARREASASSRAQHPSR